MNRFLRAGSVALQQKTHVLSVVPVVVVYLNDICNSRCMSCAIWENNERLSDPAMRQMSLPLLAELYVRLERWRTVEVLLSGGEPTMHPLFTESVARLHAMAISVQLATNGLTLARYSAPELSGVVSVLVSFDAPDRGSYLAIRGVDGYDQMIEGVSSLRSLGARPRIVARCTLQRANVGQLPELVDAARRAGFDTISFLAVDTNTDAFGRAHDNHAVLNERIAPSTSDLDAMQRGIELLERQGDVGFIESGTGKLRTLHRYFQAKLGGASFPPVRCNAPWTSVVVETSGSIRPCFFHRVIGGLPDLNGDDAVAFRRSLDVTTNAICRQCVCSKSFGFRGVMGLGQS